MQKRIQNPAEHLKLKHFAEVVITFNRKINLQKAPFLIFGWLLNTPLES